MSDNPLSSKISLDTTDYKTGIAEMTRSMKVVESGFKAVAAGMEDWEKTSVGLEARIKSLTTMIGLQQQKVSAIEGEYKRVAAEKGATSKAAQDLEIRLNKENEALNKMQLELGQSDSKLKALGGGLEDAGNKAQKAETGFQKLGARAIELNQVFDLAGKAVDATNQAYDLLIADVAAYADEVRDLARISGMSSEQASATIQTLDDLFVSYDTIKTAAKALAKDGIALTIDALADASDEYLSYQDAGERAEYASKKFKGASQELTKALEVGGDALREMAKNQNQNMLLTEEQTKKALKLKQAQDALADSTAGLSYQIGMDLIPKVTAFIELWNEFLSLDSKRWFQDAADASANFIWQFFYGKESVRDFADEAQYLEGKFDNMAGAAVDAERANKLFNEGVARASSSVNKFKNDLSDLDITERNTVSTQKALAEQIAAFEKSYQTLRSTILSGGMQIYQSTQEWKDKQAELNEKIQETQGKIAALSSIKYLTPAQKTELDELKIKLGEQKQAIIDAEIAHDKATKTMIYNMLLQKAASDGLTATEFTNLMKVAVSFGLVDQASADMARHINEIDLGDANAELGGIDSKLSHIMGLPNDKTFTITTFHNEYWNQPPSSPTVAPRASGGSVDPKTPYLVGERGMELFVPAVKGVIIPTNKLAAFFETANLANLGSPRTSSQASASTQPIQTGTVNNVTVNGTPEREMDMRKLARYVVEEIQRNQ